MGDQTVQNDSPAEDAPPAVILAAGRGKRLGSLTAQLPKAMLEIGGRSLLHRALTALESAGVTRAVIVVGHAADRIVQFVDRWDGGLDVRLVANDRYADTNNIVSLLAAREHLVGGFCLLNSDIIFDPSILHDLFAKPSGVWLVVDHDEPLGREEMKVQIGSADVAERISKALSPEESVGEYIGIARFDAQGAATLLATAQDLVDQGNEQLYYEDAINQALPQLRARLLFTTRRPWTEVDDHDDYRRAQVVADAIDRAAHG